MMLVKETDHFRISGFPRFPNFALVLVLVGGSSVEVLQQSLHDEAGEVLYGYCNAVSMQWPMVSGSQRMLRAGEPDSVLSMIA